jgi:hypothetical protein
MPRIFPRYTLLRLMFSRPNSTRFLLQGELVVDNSRARYRPGRPSNVLVFLPGRHNAGQRDDILADLETDLGFVLLQIKVQLLEHIALDLFISG